MSTLHFLALCALIGAVLGLAVNTNSYVEKIAKKETNVSCVILDYDSDEEDLE